jgi:uncharacterized protein YjiS (DUF1127 family)
MIMTVVDGIGYFAASLVLGTFCAKTMVPLRALAIASNAAFITYAACADLWPILVLHTIMLPLNLLRLREALGEGAAPAMVDAPIIVTSGGREPKAIGQSGRGVAEMNTGMELRHLLRLWRARHRHRHELAILSGGDLRDARLSTDLVAQEICKWPWQPFSPQWPGLDAALLRGIEARQPRRERRPLLPGRALWQPMWRRNMGLARTVIALWFLPLFALLAYLR